MIITPTTHTCFLEEKGLGWSSAQIGRSGVQLIIFTLSSTMGNQTFSCCNHATPRHLDELCSLMTMDYNSPSQLSFDPYGPACCSSYIQDGSAHERNQADLGISKMVDEGEETQPMPRQVAQEANPFQICLESNGLSLSLIQKNQITFKRIIKNKQIKKSQKANRIQTVQTIDQEECQFNPEDNEINENGENSSEEIRDQNNCKCYHKLVKNYLLPKGLGHLFDEYDVQYHTRYYFVVALIFIKYYLKQDFNEVYAQIVRKELDSQKRKVNRKLQEKEKVEKEIRQMDEGSRNYRELVLKRQALEKKISHIHVVMYEIEAYSMRSCRAFFSGNIEESLRILYVKDDPVMRKKYYFDSALEAVTKIQAQVRQATSRNC